MSLDMAVRKIIHIDTGILLVNTDGRTLETFVGRISRLSRLHADIVDEVGQADRSDIIAENGHLGMSRHAAYQFKRCLKLSGEEGAPVLCRPYLSELARATCSE